MKLSNSIDINHYNYHLPDELIARYPLEQRDASRLMVFKSNQYNEHLFKELPDLLPSGSLIVFNNTKVIKARLHFRKATGALIEIFCLEPLKPHDFSLMFHAKGECTWKCLVGNAKKWKDEKLEHQIAVNNQEIVFAAEKIAVHDGWVEVKFTWPEEVFFGDVLDALGEIPIPPYLKRESENIDNQRYQTVYSKYEGSVAAPTAGLHFTDDVLGKLLQHNIKQAFVTLHVGAGTFKPVSEDDVRKHAMHVEYFEVNKSLIEQVIQFQGNITAVGTTSVRTLESLYWLGVKALEHKSLENILQWEVYELPTTYSVSESLNALLQYMNKHKLEILQSASQIIIVPGYDFKIVNRLVTNFHQPKSTLLLLIAAFIGNGWKEMYNEAVAKNFRFLSYGDSSLLIP
jgi:S-adenosylmethionine:tRNA ribosyltransferase-isomerase